MTCYCGNKDVSLIFIVYSPELRAFRLTKLLTWSFTASLRGLEFILSSLRAQTEKEPMGVTGISPWQPQWRVKFLNKTVFPAGRSLPPLQEYRKKRVYRGVASSSCRTHTTCFCWQIRRVYTCTHTQQMLVRALYIWVITIIKLLTFWQHQKIMALKSLSTILPISCL